MHTFFHTYLSIWNFLLWQQFSVKDDSGKENSKQNQAFKDAHNVRVVRCVCVCVCVSAVRKLENSN